MTRRVAHDGAGKLEIDFSYDEVLKDLVKNCVPRRRFDWERKIWTAPESEVVAEAWNRFATARTRSVAEERILVRLQ